VDVGGGTINMRRMPSVIAHDVVGSRKGLLQVDRSEKMGGEGEGECEGEVCGK